MQKVTKYQTLDGVLHDTEQAARHHADKVYGVVLSSLAHEALRVEKYLDMLEFFNKNLDRFLKLQALKEDTKLQEADIF